MEKGWMLGAAAVVLMAGVALAGVPEGSILDKELDAIEAAYKSESHNQCGTPVIPMTGSCPSPYKEFTLYPDRDKDGFGARCEPVKTCSNLFDESFQDNYTTDAEGVPVGYSVNARDCDDRNNQRFPRSYPGSELVLVYRGFHAKTGDHLYSTSYAEVTSNGYQEEAPLGWGWSSQLPGMVPVIRMFDAKTGDHLYTTNPLELPANYKVEAPPSKPAWYVYEKETAETDPVFRLYRPAEEDHMYTMNGTEKAALVPKPSAKPPAVQDEGVLGYMLQVNQNCP